MSARELTAAQVEGIRKHCLNGVCKMTPENARLFRMWRDNFSRFDQMIKSTYQVSRRTK